MATSAEPSRLRGFLDEVVVDLARAEHHALDLLRVGFAVASGMTSWKLAVDEFVEASTPPACGAAATSASSPSSGLRQARSICRRSMWNICAGVVGTHTCMLSSAHNLQVALETRGGMLGALALVAVRQQQHDAAQAAPLRLRPTR
jgi:hypothetical protein